MKICYIIHGFQIGGAETIATNYLCELKHQGHDVYVISISSKESFLSSKLKNNGITVYSLSPYVYNDSMSEIIKVMLHKINGWTGYFDAKISRFIDDINPDVLHWHTSICYNSKINIPLSHQFYTFHADVKRRWDLFTDKEKKELGIYVKGGLNIIVLNEKMLQDAQKLLSTNNVTLIPNGLCIADIHSKSYSRESFLPTIDLPSEAFIIAMVGRFHPVKNQEWAIEVFSEVIKKKKDAYLLYVGQVDKDVKSKVDSKIIKNKIPSNHIRFLGLRNDATSILSISDVCIIPSRSESFSLVAVEAQAFNVRVIASDAIPNSVLRNANTFELSLNDSAEKWANAILSKDVDVTKDGGIELFDIKNVISKHIQLYKSVCQY